MKTQVAANMLDLVIMTSASQVKVVRDFSGAIESLKLPTLRPIEKNQKFIGKAFTEWSEQKIEERKA